ncbi:hypothetical protein [Streptomyces sp. UG1]|uniref:hypothetical protein n=1 Tax=Streptomyces sp. UG1 TaxID=3417652 RepID=UPI003CFB6BD8
MRWYARVTVAGVATDPTEDQLAYLMTKLRSVTRDKVMETLTLAWEINELSLADAVTEAVSQAEKMLTEAGLLARIVDVRVGDEDTSTEIDDLLGYAEIAIVLGVSRQRAAQLAKKHKDFPSPVAALAGRPLYTPASIARFAERWERKTGRPSAA